jgi:hypothetical protein
VIPHQLAEAGAAYASVGEQQSRRRHDEEEGEEDEPAEQGAG